MRKAEKIGIWLAVITLVVTSGIALGAWLLPRQPKDPDLASGAQNPPQPVPAGSTPPAATVPPALTGNGNATYLATLGPQSGGGNLAALPRALNGKAGYEQPIVVQCPTNQTGDKVRSVTYLLRGRYLDFAATVRPYYTAVKDSRTHVHARTGVKERDGTLTQQTKGTQFGATMEAPATVAADVEGAEELTIQVECEHPQGVVVLAGARLSDAP
jgi:hypothetical protein